MATTRTLTLQTLPAEVRDLIFELALFHSATDGVISPKGDGRGKASIIFIHGQRRKPSKLHLTTNLAPLDAESQFSNTIYSNLPAPCSYSSVLDDDDDDDDDGSGDHTCTLGCLVQPPLTRVNHQFREEALCIFYGIHHFHFEMGNHQTDNKFNGRIPADWWRAVGDTNLRSIRHLSIVCQPTVDIKSVNGGGEQNAAKNERAFLLQRMVRHRKSFFMVDYVRGAKQAQGTVTMTQIHGDAHRAEPTIFLPLDMTKESCIDRYVHQLVRPHFDLLQSSGLNVRELECVVANTEYMNFRCLRDYSTVSDDMEVMARVAKRDEEREEAIMKKRTLAMFSAHRFPRL